MRAFRPSVVVFITLVCVFATQGFAGQLNGGYSLFYTQKAQLLDPGELNIVLHMRGYSKVISDADFTLVNGTGAVSSNFGFSRYLEFGITMIVYQDLNLSQETINGKLYAEQIPDDMILRMKFGGWGIPVKSSLLRLAFDLDYRLRTALIRRDVYLEPYSSEALEFGINMLLSFYANAFYPDESHQFHANLGYLNHNDSGLGAGLFNSAQELLYSFGYVYPTLLFDIHAEFNGSHFAEAAPLSAYSREDYLYFAPGLTYKPFYGFNLQFAMEWLILDKENTTEGRIIPPNYPGNYPPWRLSGNLVLYPTTAFFSQPTFAKVTKESKRRERLLEKAGLDRRALFEWVTDEDFGKEYIDLELEKIRQERKKAEEELEKLKKELGK
jgi:hypothetical protein